MEKEKKTKKDVKMNKNEVEIDLNILFSKDSKNSKRNIFFSEINI